MRFLVLIMLAMAVIMAYPSDNAGAGQLSGPVGRLLAVERVVELDCRPPSNDGRCAFVAVSRGLELLGSLMDHFRCTSTTGRPMWRLTPSYAPWTKHDPGAVIAVEADDIRCAIDPRGELGLVDRDALSEACSRMEWKCNVIWMPDEDQSIVFIGLMGK